MSLTLSGTNGLSDVDGSAATPAIRGTDTNTGIFFPAADTVGITTGGTERARVDSSGNLGLGVTPSAWGSGYTGLDIKYLGISNTGAGTVDCSFTQNGYYNGTNWVTKYTSPSKRYSISDSGHIWYNGASTTAGSAITFTQAMTLDANGKLLVGGTASDLSSTSQAMIMGSGGLAVQNAGTAGTFLSIVPGAANGTVDIKADARTGSYPPLTFYTGNSERARIDSSGNLLVATTNSSDTSGVGFKLRQVSTQTQVSSVCSGSLNTYVLYNTAAGAYRFYVSDAGQIFATSTSITGISDQTLKENIRDLETGLTEVMALQPRRFDWKNGDDTNVAGFIAQEVEQVLPELVTDYVYKKDEEGNDITKKSLKMGDMLPTLVKAIQEQQAIITSLTARITALEQA